MIEIIQLILMFIFIPITLFIINIFLSTKIMWSLSIAYVIMFLYSVKYSIILIMFSPLISLFISAVIFSFVAIIVVEFASSIIGD